MPSPSGGAESASTAAAVADVPEEVLRYLAGLDDAAGQALLARARGLATSGKGSSGSNVASPSEAPSCGGHGSTCACHDSVQDLRQAVEQPPSELAAPGEEAKDAAQSLARALAAGDLKAAEDLWRKADLGHCDESGWTCLQWLVHTAGTALSNCSAREGEGQHAPHDSGSSLLAGSHSGCCAPAPAGSGSRTLLHDALAHLVGAAGVAAVNARGVDGATPLMFAADAQDRQACEWLLAAGADPTVKDADGDTAAAWARAKGDEYLACWLEDCPKSK